MTLISPRGVRCATLFLLAVSLSGCSALVSSLTSDMAADLEATILNSRDVDTVEEGVPAYLLMIDSFLLRSPDDADLLLAASTLNGAFSTFTDEARTGLLTTKALDYALKAACISVPATCGMRELDFDAYRKVVDGLERRHVRTAYAAGTAWAGWIQAHSDDWGAIAQLAKVEYLMGRVIELDETWENGGPHLYMGALETVLPRAMGGNPDEGKRHFERAIEIADGRNLMAKVIYAEQYARLVFDKDLHDRLLREVLDADPVAPDLTLSNSVAQRRAERLLKESDEYF